LWTECKGRSKLAQINKSWLGKMDDQISADPQWHSVEDTFEEFAELRQNVIIGAVVLPHWIRRPDTILKLNKPLLCHCPFLEGPAPRHPSR
jgi:hypothetical protein